jgi:hypothetical protein
VINLGVVVNQSEEVYDLATGQHLQKPVAELLVLAVFLLYFCLRPVSAFILGIVIIDASHHSVCLGFLLYYIAFSVVQNRTVAIQMVMAFFGANLTLHLGLVKSWLRFLCT